jgi:hypothetical protein
VLYAFIGRLTSNSVKKTGGGKEKLSSRYPISRACFYTDMSYNHFSNSIAMRTERNLNSQK